MDGCVEDKGETTCVGNVHPLVVPVEGDGNLIPWAIAGVGDSVLRGDVEHLSCGELPFPSAFSGGKAPEDGGDHLVVVLEGIAIAPRWSATSGSVIGVVVQLFVLEFLSQPKAVLHFVLSVLVERARAVEDLPVLLIIVALGARFVDGSDDVVWPAVAILARLGPFLPILTAIIRITTVVETAVAVASVGGAVVILACWSLDARILIEAHLGLLGIGVLVGGCDHLADAGRWLSIELRTEFEVMKSSDEGGDDFGFRDVGNRIPHVEEASDVVAE